MQYKKELTNTSKLMYYESEANIMEIYDYKTAGGKNLIIEYIESLPKSERLELYDIRCEIRKSGMDAFEKEE